MIVARQPQVTIREAKERALFWVNLFLARKQHVNSGVNQKCSEYIHDPSKFLKQLGAGNNHHAAHDQSTDNPPLQHAVLKPLVDRKGAENNQEEKEIVDA